MRIQLSKKSLLEKSLLLSYSLLTWVSEDPRWSQIFQFRLYFVNHFNFSARDRSLHFRSKWFKATTDAIQDWNSELSIRKSFMIQWTIVYSTNSNIIEIESGLSLGLSLGIIKIFGPEPDGKPEKDFGSSLDKNMVYCRSAYV